MNKFLLGIFLICVLHLRAQVLVTSVEAEAGTLTGLTKNNAEAGSSGQYVTGFDQDGDKLSVNVNIPAAGAYQLVIRYRSVSGNKTNDVWANGAFVAAVIFPQVQTFTDLQAGTILLKANSNTIEIRKSWGYFDVDKILIYTKQPNRYFTTSRLGDPSITPEAQKLYNFIRANYGVKIMTGQTSDYYDEVVKLTGKKPLVRGFDLLTYSPMYPWNSSQAFGPYDNGEVDRAISWYNETQKKGIVTIHWHWYSPSGGQLRTNTFYTNQTTFDVTKAVTPGTQENTDALRDIDAIAVQLKKIRDAGIPVIWRPLHEAGGAWFWWGAKGPQACLALWDMLRDRLANVHGLHNLIWSWSTPEADWYPGDDKIDILGFDSYPGLYNYTTQKNLFDQLHKIGGERKIVAMTENGPIPNIAEALSHDARWSWFVSWNTLVAEQNSSQHIIQMYNDPNALTVENCPAYQIVSAAEPEYSPEPGEYDGPQNVVISSDTDGATLYYTMDGTEPSTISNKYTSPVFISSGVTLKAIAVKSGMINSLVTSSQYVISSVLGIDAERHVAPLIYPNPVDTSMIVDLTTWLPEPVTITIRDLQGKIVLKEKRLRGNKKLEIALQLSSGAYMVQIQSKSKSVIEKVFVERN
jgi:mannan endo-1,4-beta-mannosidase